MQCLTWMAPILPGKLDAWEEFDEQMVGPRHAEHDASRRRMGLTREVASLLRTPHGDFVCLYHEASDLAKAFRILVESDDPYDVWFCENIRDIHGLTAEMMTGTPPAVLRLDWSDNS